MAHIRFTDLVTNKVSTLPAANMRLFNYAVKVATSETLIELIDNDMVVKSHHVYFVDKIPSMLHR